jgi:putative OmpL-like beta-barrel porin-2
MRRWLAMVIGTGLITLLPRGAAAVEPTYSLGVTPLVYVAQTEAKSPSAGDSDRPGFFGRLFRAYYDSFNPPATTENEPEPPRRGMPPAFESPPYPSTEYQGYPLIGVPYSAPASPLMKALEGTPVGDFMSANRLYLYGWISAAPNVSSSSHSNSPESYWLVPNTALLDQLVVRLERPVDSVQKNHVDWGFRSSFLFGTDYRYMTAGGWTSDQLLGHNRLYGYDFTEQYVDVYVPGIADGTIIRIGRWIATPDIETQFTPDNYIGSHSLLFTFDTYTQTGFMVTHQLNRQWTFQWGVHAGTDMAPWYRGAVPTGFLGVRWVAPSNDDSIYLVLNSINTAKFQKFIEDGQPAGHDNFNYLVGTWQHRFTSTGSIHTKTEGYLMWQRDAVVGGTPSIGPVRSFGGGGGIGADLPGLSWTYGIVNYTMFQVSKRDYFTVRNEWWRDERGERSGFASTYSSHTVGWSHQLSDVFMIRPEIGYFHSYDAKAFDLGQKNYLWQFGMDVTMRF